MKLYSVQYVEQTSSKNLDMKMTQTITDNWTYQGNSFDLNILEDPHEFIGFIYCITNQLDGRKYIGKKTLYSTRRVMRTITLKSGVKKRKKVTQIVESDWKDYWSSSAELQGDVERLGKENFSREILILCKTKAELSYMETKTIFSYDCLLDPSRWYNAFVSCRINRSHLKHILVSSSIENVNTED